MTTALAVKPHAFQPLPVPASKRRTVQRVKRIAKHDPMNRADIVNKIAPIIGKHYHVSTPIPCSDEYCESLSGLARKPHAHYITPLTIPVHAAATFYIGKARL